ncbi:ankyrin repeat-containing domain protein [Talaromyces proteolyticus]|uniref:protein S-acyltransferase n=1 Tax=Talaromyces proteolyticus TaxID=1131652 RepID=A0AAD4KL86_9EURO|nr:ankyrin repeat-containing domain protein [Talaromyces proteolyticus]KAH8691836.1 ankyrin repeat-containing domain protein [Talaromyces proteolyticus]
MEGQAVPQNIVSLPIEIILMIINNLPSHTSILSLARTCKFLSGLSVRMLYQLNIRYENSSVFHWAVETGRIDLVENMLCGYSPNVNTVDMLNPGKARSETLTSNADKLTPIMTAVRRNYQSIFLLLLERGDVDFTYQDNLGRNVLRHAASTGNVFCVQKLLARNTIDINTQDKLGRTALAIAVKRDTKRHRDVVRMLLEVDEIDINRADKNGSTPLHISVRSHNPIIQLLLSHPMVKVNQIENNGSTPLMIATHRPDDTLTFNTLLHHTDVNMDQQDHRGRTALVHAIYRDNRQAVRALLRKGCRDIPDFRGMTPLSWAVWKQRKPIVEDLLADRSARGIAFSDADNPSSRLAVQHGNVEIMKLLIRYSIDVN